MVAVKKNFSYLPDGSIDIESWLNKIKCKTQLQDIELLKDAIKLAQTTNQGLTTFYGQPCIEHGLEMAEILIDLNLDQEAIAAAIVANMSSSIGPPTTEVIEIIKNKLGNNVANLVSGIQQMGALDKLIKLSHSRNQIQLDKLRKIFLAIASDIRAALIKLAERTCIMRGIKNTHALERKRIAQETMDIYAPLANRLGLGQLKWELEDTAFHYINPDAYKTIAKFLAERRIDRETRINTTIARLKESAAKINLQAEITGRPKHIYSIYLKMQRKLLNYKDIYDYSAIRLLVPSITDCYTALSIVHQLFDHIPEEFDDYISHPKPNGYRSIHTAVIGPEGKNLEIQIRTFSMHEEAEHGIAAHWVYKENKQPVASYEAKILYLRQLLAWHKELAQQNFTQNQTNRKILEDRIYALTPAGDIIDLPVKATPLDFAYHIHSELGHSCRGAKVNGHIVPLTYQLCTGDQVEVITAPSGTPSRDWLNKEAGYLTTARARSKIAHWFKQQDNAKYIEEGRHQLERELSRIGIQQPNLDKIAARLHFKNNEALLIAIAHGNLRIAQVIHTLQSPPPQEVTQPFSVSTHTKQSTPPTKLQIAGVNDLLTRVAQCCKPIPGDKIIGYITQGRGVSIHRQNCNNLFPYFATQSDRLIPVSWDNKEQPDSYHVDLQIRGTGQHNILKEISTLLVNTKVDLVGLNSTISKKENMIYIIMTILVRDLAQLNHVTNQISQLPKVISVRRISK